MEPILTEAIELNYYSSQCEDIGKSCIMGEVLDVYLFERKVYAIKACRKCKMIRVYHVTTEEEVKDGIV